MATSKAHAFRFKNTKCKNDYHKWKDLSGYKAFFVTVDGYHCGWSFNYSTKAAAKKRALSNCHKYARGGKCVLFKLR